MCCVKNRLCRSCSCGRCSTGRCRPAWARIAARHKPCALVNSIPTAIVGGVSFVLYGMISAVGVRNVVENRVDLTKSRNLIIAAVIFVCGLGFASTGGITFTVGNADITLTGLAIAALAGVILNAVLPGNDYEFGKSVEGDASADLGSY